MQGNPFKTRDDVAQAVIDLVEPLLPHFSAGRARVDLGATGARHDVASAELEGFARPLWGIAPFAAGGYDFPYWNYWREGLANGTDPDHPEFWGWPADNDQRLVELAAIGMTLRLVPEHIWEPLDARARKHVSDYLAHAHSCAFANCNWKFFRLLIGLGLEQIGRPFDPVLHTDYLADIDAYYLDKGWYFDGKPRQVDHYIPFAFQFYGLLYAELGGNSARAAIFRQRAAEFTKEIADWYADDGAALPFGRSLTYRFAHAGIWGALAYCGIDSAPPGVLKGFYLRNLRWWARQPIFDKAGLLTIGFAYPNLLMSEGYNAPGSPYWAMKAFLPLALAEDHLFWTEPEQPAPVTDGTVVQPQTGMVIQTQPGHKVALCTGQELGYMRHGAEKYSKFAYSTRYGFSVEVDERQFEQAAAENMILFSDDGVHFRGRAHHEEALLADDVLYSRWKPFADVEAETWLVPAGRWHIRLHEVNTPRRLDTIEGGFAIARPVTGAWDTRSDGDTIRIATQEDYSVIVADDARDKIGHLALPNGNVMNARTILPQLRGHLEPGVSRLACAVSASPLEAGSLPRPDFPSIEALRQLVSEKGHPVPSCQRKT
jgi:hypothetical protein